jgi:hypothetical protein
MWSAAKPMLSSLLQALQSRAGNAATVKQRVIDDADAVVELSTPQFTVVAFPTADTLPEVRSPQVFLTAKRQDFRTERLFGPGS